MKIDEESINHNAVGLIKDVMPWDMCGEHGDDNISRAMTLGYIQGICDLAEELKKVLDA